MCRWEASESHEFPTGFNEASFAMSGMQEPLNWFLYFSQRELVCVLLISVSVGDWGGGSGAAYLLTSPQILFLPLFLQVTDFTHTDMSLTKRSYMATSKSNKVCISLPQRGSWIFDVSASDLKSHWDTFTDIACWCSEDTHRILFQTLVCLYDCLLLSLENTDLTFSLAFRIVYKHFCWQNLIWNSQEEM